MNKKTKTFISARYPDITDETMESLQKLDAFLSVDEVEQISSSLYLRELKVKGAFCFKAEYKHTFTDSYSIISVPKNRGGKTATYRALLYALYGKQALFKGYKQTSDVVLNTTSKVAHFEVSFTCDDINYQVKRVIELIDGKYHTSASFKCLDTDDEIVGESEVLNTINALIGTHKTFVSKTYFSPHTILEVVPSKEKDLMDVMSKYIDSEIYDVKYQKVGELIKTKIKPFILSNAAFKRETENLTKMKNDLLHLQAQHTPSLDLLSDYQSCKDKLAESRKSSSKIKFLEDRITNVTKEISELSKLNSKVELDSKIVSLFGVNGFLDTELFEKYNTVFNGFEELFGNKFKSTLAKTKANAIDKAIKVIGDEFSNMKEVFYQELEKQKQGQNAVDLAKKVEFLKNTKEELLYWKESQLSADEIQELSDRFEILKSQYEEVKKNEKQIAFMQVSIDNLDAKLKTHCKYERQYEIAKMYSDIHSSNGVVKWLLSTMVSNEMQKLNTWLKQCGFTFGLNIEFTVKGMTVTMVNEQGEKIAMSNASGLEELAYLVFVLYCQLVLESHKINLFWFDEVFDSSVSEENAHIVEHLVNGLAKRKNVQIITHRNYNFKLPQIQITNDR